MISDALPPEPVDEPDHSAVQPAEPQGPPAQTPSPQAPAALGGMGSTGPITIVRKKP